MKISRVLTTAAAAALVIPLAATAAQAAPITRTSTCAKFTGDYTYWSDGTGWYGFSLSGRITRTCAGSAVHGIQVTGDREGGDSYYNYQGHLLSQGQSKTLTGFYEPYSVKNIRIALD